MRKILFLFILLAGLAFSQTYNVTFQIDSGATVSDSIQFKDDQQFLSAIFVSDTLDMDSFYVQVCFDAGTDDTTAAGTPIWYYVYEAGDRYIAVGDNTDAVMISIKQLALYPVNEGSDPREIWVRLVITTDDKEIGDISIKGITKTFQ